MVFYSPECTNIGVSFILLTVNLFRHHTRIKHGLYSKTCKKLATKKINKTRILTIGSLMKNAPLGAFCNTFDLHKAKIGLENQFLVFLSWSFHILGPRNFMQS